MGDWQAFGAIGEWAAAIVTLGALGFAWWQFDKERAEVGKERDELALQRKATEGALKVAQDALDFERARYEADREERDRRVVAGFSVVGFSVGFEASPSVTISVHNKSPWSIFDVQAFLVFQGVVLRSSVRSDPVFPSYAIPDNLVITETGQKRERLLHDNTGYGVTFRDDLGNTWAKWSTGRVIRWTPGDTDGLGAGR